MKVNHYAAMAVLAWSAALPASARTAANAMHDSTVLAGNLTAPEPLTRSAPAPAPHWNLAAGQRPASGTTLPATHAARAMAPAPETSMYSMLLIGLGLLALCGARARQEKFDQGR